MNRSSKLADRLAVAMARPDALLAFTFCGALVGLVSSSIILAFRLLIDSAVLLDLMRPVTLISESSWTIIKIGGGGLLLWLIFHLLKTDSRQAGVTHVIERLSQPIARLPVVNMVGQFFGAAVAIASGFSVGREGPGVHLGASSGSQLGLYLGLPNNSLRTLIGCGCAAAIAASFNTPLAAVIFTLEVFAFDYVLVNLAPVLVAAVTGTVMTRLVYGSNPAFSTPAVTLQNLPELVNLLLLGAVIGVLAALFTHCLEYFSSFQKSAPCWRRFLIASIAMATIGVWLPDTLGIGYQTIDKVVAGNYLLVTLLLITLAKLLATTFCLGLGIPGGLIGPTLVIGATAGGTFYAFLIAAGVSSEELSGGDFYALLGMAAMMGATLQAPLAALTSLLEMGQDATILLPGMMTIVTATLVSRIAFGKESVFHRLLRVRGVNFETTAMHRSLREVGVLAAVDPSFEIWHREIDAEQLEKVCQSKVRWLILHDGKVPVAAVRQRSLADFMTLLKQNNLLPDEAAKALAANEPLNLPGLIAQFDSHTTDLAPPQLVTLSRVDSLATLDEAHETMQRDNTRLFYAQSSHAHGLDGIYGLLPLESVEHYYR